MLESKLQGADAAAIEPIDADVAELAALVNEILACSRAGRRDPPPRPVALQPLVMDAIKRKAAGCEVRVIVPDPISLAANPLLLERVIGNLIRNSALHAGAEASVTVAAGRHAGGVWIKVQDDGSGVPPAEMNRVLEPFYRLDKSSSRGTGLGLSIVRPSVEACGGEMQPFMPAGGGFGALIEPHDP